MEREITVLFADIRGFTTLSEELPLVELRQALNTMFGAASRLLIEHDALVDKFLGDAVMALFNAPIPQERHRESALRTALALQEAWAGLSLPFAVGIGLKTGMAITGNVGGGEVTDYTAIGDTVNVASRLSGLAQPGEILAGLATFGGLEGLLPPDYGVERLSMEVKGKAEPVGAFRIHPLRT